MRTIKTYRKVGAFYIAWEEDLSASICNRQLGRASIVSEQPTIRSELIRGIRVDDKQNQRVSFKLRPAARSVPASRARRLYAI